MLIKKFKFALTIIFFGTTLSFCSGVKNDRKDFVPVEYLKSYRISKAERQEIIADLKNIEDITKFLPKNYVRDGSIDYTEALQKGVNSHSNILLPDFPLLISDMGLILKSQSIVVFNKNTVLIKKPTDKSNYDILKISGISDVKVYFANIVGDRYTHDGKDGEWGHGIGIWSSNNIYLVRPSIKYCWGDGIYINNGEDVVIKKPFVNNNRRNGVSVISAKNLTIDSILAANSDGVAPKAGIDIEPNNNREELQNININNIITYRNTQGLLFALGAMSGRDKKEISININNHIDDSSIYALALHLDKGEIFDAKIKGVINISNYNWLNINKNRILFNRKENAKKNDIKVNLLNSSTNLNSDTQFKIRELNSY